MRTTECLRTVSGIMLADYHIHSEFSNDSEYPMEEVVNEAIRLGLDEICFTDHVDYGVKQDQDCGKEIIYLHGEPMSNVNYPEYEKQILKMRALYGDRITIRMGMEFGMQMHTIPQFEALYQRYPFDFIILSVHQVDDLEFWSQDFQRGKTRQEYQQRYYQELLDLTEHYHHYSVLGHMDLIARYDQLGTYPFEKIKPVVEKILKNVILDGKGIEVNTSSRRYGLSDTTPSKQILELYHGLGGRILTIGSDSHAQGQTGEGLEETKRMLREMGFDTFCTYDNMRPVFHKLS